MKLLEEKVPVIARFDGVGVRPLEFIWRGRRWPVRNVIQDLATIFSPGRAGPGLCGWGNRQPAPQLSYFPQSGWWRLDKIERNQSPAPLLLYFYFTLKN